MLTEIKTYKGKKIEFDSYYGKFETEINGMTKRFSSLKSAENHIDKAEQVEFKPADILVMKEKGWSPCVYSVEQVSLIGYREEEGWKRGVLNRYFVVAGNKPDKDIRIGNGTQIYSLESREKLEALAKELTEQEAIKDKAESRISKAQERLEKLEIDLDPRPEAGY